MTGIHNGIIANDEELFRRHDIDRHEPEMTVDSEVIFALVEEHGSSPEVLQELVGTMAAAWVDERDPHVLHVARGVGRPLWIAGAATRCSSPRRVQPSSSSSTRSGRGSARRKSARAASSSLVDGALASERHWIPDRSYREERELPAVRAPHEGHSCRERLAALTALA